MMSEETTTTEVRARCCVAHPDAGGPCSEPFAVEVRELAYCERHGEEARLLAAEEERHEAETFFERFRNPHVRGLSAPVERVLASLDIGPDVAAQYDDALVCAYADAPEDVRERIIAWEQDEEEEFGFGFIYDRLLQSLWLISRLQRIAYEEGETWLVEILERERQSMAAQASYALERVDLPLRPRSE